MIWVAKAAAGTLLSKNGFQCSFTYITFIYWQLRNMLLLHIFIVTSVTCLQLTSCALKLSQNYITLQPSNPASCVADNPTVRLPMTAAGSVIRCTAECTSSSCCVYVQVNNDLQQCQLYDYVPIKNTTNGRCKHYFRRFYTLLAVAVVPHYLWEIVEIWCWHSE